MRVLPDWRLCLPLLLGASVVAADVSYKEEIVNHGTGSSRRGARRTVHEIRIQKQRQRVETTIETSKEMQRVLEARGIPLQATTIVRLDQGRLYEIDAGAGTYRAKPLPPPARPAAKPVAPGDAAPAAPPAAPNRDIRVQTKVLPDTMRLFGIPCRRVAAQMLVRHYKPGTKQVQRVNRYLYQAWMAKDFPGYDEIMAFRQAQARRTSMVPVVRGGLEQLAESADDAGRLETEVAALQGFPMKSELTVHTTVGSGSPRLIFRLTRRVLQYSHQPLPESLFQPASELKPVP